MTSPSLFCGSPARMLYRGWRWAGCVWVCKWVGCGEGRRNSPNRIGALFIRFPPTWVPLLSCKTQLPLFRRRTDTHNMGNGGRDLLFQPSFMDQTIEMQSIEITCKVHVNTVSFFAILVVLKGRLGNFIPPPSPSFCLALASKQVSTVVLLKSSPGLCTARAFLKMKTKCEFCHSYA